MFMSLNSLLSFEPFTHDSSVSIISIGSPSFTAGMFLMPRCCVYPMPRMASFGACPSMVNLPPETLAVAMGFLWLPLTNTTTVFTVSGTVPLTLNVTSCAVAVMAVAISRFIRIVFFISFLIFIG